MINKEIGSWLTQNWLHFCLSDTLVKVKNLKLLDLRHNKMKEVSAYLSFFYYYSDTSVNATSFFCHLHTVMAAYLLSVMAITLFWYSSMINDSKLKDDEIQGFFSVVLTCSCVRFLQWYTGSHRSRPFIYDLIEWLLLIQGLETWRLVK